MPALVDTTIRLLGQEPLAGRVPTAEILRLAELLDDAGFVYSAGKSGETDVLVDQARRMAELGAARVLLHDPTGALLGHQSHELTQRIREATNLPVGIYCQGAPDAVLST